MPNTTPLNRLLPLALALTLIALTAIWGGWIAIGSFEVDRWPFAVTATLWPALAWAGCRSRRTTRREPPGTDQTPLLAPGAPEADPDRVAAPVSPEAEREPAGEGGPELAGAFQR